MLTWACVLYLLALSGPISCCSNFYYSKNAFRRSEGCNLCYEKECMTLEQSRCDYYAEVEAVLPKDDDGPGTTTNPKLRREVDELVFDLVDKVAGLSDNLECIPYVSRYTNCNKDNVCLGCKTCICTADGHWQCSIAAPCHSKQPPLMIDHRVLVLVMGSLIESTHSKKVKRSAGSNSEEFTTTASTISLEQIAEWFYGVKPIRHNKNSFSETPSPTETTTAELSDEPAGTPAKFETRPITEVPTTAAVTESKTINTDTDSLEFDEVLRSIAVDTKTYSRRKPLDYILSNHSFNIDYIIFDEDNATSNTDTGDNLFYMMNLMQENDAVTAPPVSDTTKIVIDLLSAAEQLGAKSNTNEDGAASNKDIDTNALENMNDVIDYNTLNIMKREVKEQNHMTAPSLVPVVTIIVNTTNNTRDNITGESLPTGFKESILIPFNKIIFEKIKELENLKKIKDNLTKFVKSDGTIPEDVENSTGNTYFSIYNFAMRTGLSVGTRRSNLKAYDKYALKLKNDIFEVIRDITAIKQLKGSGIPGDLNYLLNSMKRYVYKNQWHDNKQKKTKVKKARNFRRHMNQNVGHCAHISFKDCLIKILELIDKNSPKSNAFTPLSPTSRRIMKHIVNSFYVDELALAGVRVHDPNYNLTKDLQMIGIQWPEMSANLLTSTPFASLFRMKLLHFSLTSDISKINDALSLIDFSHSRRMLPSLDRVNDDVLDKIDAGLTAIHDKMQIIIKYSLKPNASETTNPPAEGETYTKPVNTTDTKKKKNRSFIKHIRSLLETSKKDIAELLHRKVPKSEIVKQLAKKKLDEISEKRYNEYEEAMKRWQKNLEVTSRNKRSVLDGFSARIKNIIPRYLRHKVNPKIATANATRFADKLKKKRMALTRGRMRKRTTPRPKKLNGNVVPKTTKAYSSA